MTRKDFQRATATVLVKTGDVNYDIFNSTGHKIGELKYGSIPMTAYFMDYGYICTFTHNDITVNVAARTQELCMDKASTRYNSEVYLRSKKP